MNISQIIEETIKQELKKAEKETNTNPTQGQKEAGNYKKGRVNIHGFEIAIENPKGSYRKGVDDTGREWKTKMNNTYGYFVQSKAIDGDAVDVFIGDNLDSDKIFCIDQYKGNEFDETKVMMGFNNSKEAKKAYLSNYEKGWNGFKYITEVDIEIFKVWLNSHKNKKQRKAIYFYKSLAEQNIIELSSVISPYHGVIGSAEPGSEKYKIGIEMNEETLDETTLKISDIVKDILSESKESKNLSKARKYLKDVHEMSQEQTQRILDNIRTNISNSRVAECKYMLGIVRMYVSNQLKDYTIINDLNKSLKFLEGHDDYNEDLNGLSAEELVNRFQTVGQQHLETDKNKINQKRYNDKNNRYTIIPIDSYEDAREYYEYAPWCVAQSENNYNTYTKDGLGRFYFLLNEGWENIGEESKEEGNPLDDYGLSMIAVGINDDGSLNTCTTRYNHDNGGNDNSMNTEQISDLIGRNFYSVFKPYSEEELHIKKEKLKYFREDNLNELFKIDDLYHGDIRLNRIKGLDEVWWIVYKNKRFNVLIGDDKGNIIDPNSGCYSLLFPEYEHGFTSHSGYNEVSKTFILFLDKTYNIGKTDGTMMFNNWIPFENHDETPDTDKYGYTLCRNVKDNCDNIIDPNGKFLFDTVKPIRITNSYDYRNNKENCDYKCRFYEVKYDNFRYIGSKEKNIIFNSRDNSFFDEDLRLPIRGDTINEYIENWKKSEDGLKKTHENTIKDTIQDYLNEIQLSPLKQQKKTAADNADTLRDISFEEDDDNADPDDRMEEIDEHKIDLLIDVINNKTKGATESFLILKYILGDTSVNLSFISQYVGKINDAANIIKTRLTTQRSKVYIYNFILDQVDQSGMSGAQRMELRDMMEKLSNVITTRNVLTRNAMESKTYIQDMVFNETQKLAPDLFKTGKEQKKLVDQHLQQLAARNGDDINIGEIVSEDNQKLKHRTFQIPEELYFELKSKYDKVKDVSKYTLCKNYKRLQNIIERKGKITYKWMYTLVDWRDNYTGQMSGEEQDKDAWLISADKLMKWVDEELRRATEVAKSDKEITPKLGAIAHTSGRFRTVESLVKEVVGEDYNYLFEMSAKDIHKTYYPDIPEDVFKQIASADTVTTNLDRDKLGKYAKWLLWLYTDKKRVKSQLKLEDLYKAKEYLPVFDKLSKSGKLENNNINSHISLSSLYSVIRPYLEGEEFASKGEEIKHTKVEGADKLYEDDAFVVIHPKTEEAAKYYGKGTQWCTAAENNNMFDHYNKNGPLYIVIGKRYNEKYQFHFESEQFMDETDESIYKPVMDEINATSGLFDFFEERVGVKKMLGLSYDNISELEDGTFVVSGEYNDSAMLLDVNGAPIFYDAYSSIELLYNNTYLVSNDDGYVIINGQEEELTSYYDDIIPIGGNKFIVHGNEGKGVIDINDEEIIPLIYSEIENIDVEGMLFRVKQRTDKVGIINLKTSIKIPPEYDTIVYDSNGMYRVKQNNLVGVLDSNGEIVIPIKYLGVLPEKDNTYRVRNDLNKEGIINLNNEVIKPFGYSKYSDGLTPGEFISLDGNGKRGVVDVKGNVIIPFIYNRIEPYNNFNVYFVSDESKRKGVIDKNNNIIIPIEYYDILPDDIKNKYIVYKSMSGYYNDYKNERIVFDLNGNQIEDNNLAESKNSKPKRFIMSERQVDVIQSINKLGITVEDVIDYIRNTGPYDGLYPGSDDDNGDEDGNYPFESEKQMITKILSICQYFAKFENPFPVWRSIRVDKLSDIKRDELLGNSWSFSHDSAVRFRDSIWGNSGNTILKADCPFDAVDWVETISRYIEDNTNETSFNGNNFSENEIYIEIPERLENVQVEQTMLTEGVDRIRKILNEVLQIPYDEQKENDIYIFNYDPNGAPDYMSNCVYSKTNRFDKTGTVVEWYDDNDNLVCYYQVSSKRGETLPSEYFQTPPCEESKYATRGSDHWSFYIIRNYIYNGENVTLVINDIKNKIKNLYYILELPPETGSYINIKTIKGVVKDIPDRKFTLSGQTYIVLGKNSVTRYLDAIRKGKYLYGTAKIANSDTAIFPFINDFPNL